MSNILDTTPDANHPIAIQHAKFMQAAIKQAHQSLKTGGIPIGAVLVHQGKIIGQGHNQRVQKGSTILHGEMDALENAQRQKAQIYRESVLYTTLAPCAMCTGAILLYQIPHVIVGEDINFKGAAHTLPSHGVKLEILQDPTCIQMMKDFVKQFPELWYEDIGE